MKIEITKDMYSTLMHTLKDTRALTVETETKYFLERAPLHALQKSLFADTPSRELKPGRNYVRIPKHVMLYGPRTPHAVHDPASKLGDVENLCRQLLEKGGMPYGVVQDRAAIFFVGDARVSTELARCYVGKLVRSGALLTDNPSYKKK